MAREGSSSRNTQDSMVVLIRGACFVVFAGRVGRSLAYQWKEITAPLRFVG